MAGCYGPQFHIPRLQIFHHWQLQPEGQESLRSDLRIPPFDNQNKPIVDMDDKHVPLNYFNIVKLNKDQSFEYLTPGYETCIVPSTGTIDIEVGCGSLEEPVFNARLASAVNLS